MSRKIVGITALITLLFAANIQGSIAGVNVEVSLRGESQSEVQSISPGVERLWTDLPYGIIDESQDKREVSTSYGPSIEGLHELKHQSFALSQDKNPTIEVNSTGLEPDSPDPIYLLQDFEGPDLISGVVGIHLTRT